MSWLAAVPFHLTGSESERKAKRGSEAVVRRRRRTHGVA